MINGKQKWTVCEQTNKIVYTHACTHTHTQTRTHTHTHTHDERKIITLCYNMTNM